MSAENTKVTSARAAAMSSVRLALLAQQVREQVDDDALAAEPIAIIGMGCRFPGGADTPTRFWDLLRRGGDAIGEIPPERWEVDAFYDPDPFAPGKMNTRWGGFLEDIDRFDAAFFSISPREASHMDPQQRLLLEVAIEALERAGQPSDRLSGSLTGVFVASSLQDYGDRQHESPDDVDAYSLTGNAQCIIANRLSYSLDLRGPSLAVDTACSSSLVAVHMACQSLRNRDSHMALAAGVNIVLSPEPSIAMAKWGLMAADGRCKTFDARADGFVRSEGCGVVVLKRLSDAIADNDPVVAVIRGSAVNQDGRSTAMTAPNGLAQQDVIRRALSNSRVLPEQIGCIEAHGTGTVLGDPIEVEALAAVIGAQSAGAPPVALTAVKSNVGHLEAAAGMAGLIKVVLCLQHEEIPPNLHFTNLNPHISLDGTRLFIPTSAHPWPAGATRRLAGVSSFGVGGTNAHVVVEEAPRLPASPAADGPFVLPVSAQTPNALRDAALLLAAHLESTNESAVGDVCFTAGVRRTHYTERLTVVGKSRADLIDCLRLFLGGERRPGIAAGRRELGERRRIAFVLSGQGPQWWAMGRELMAGMPVFAEMLQRCDALLRQHVEWSLLDQFSIPEAESRLDETEIAQPALFALQVGLAAVWRSWGITPDAVVGHSVGEVAAAYISGALTLEDAIRVIAHRGRFMQQATGNGTMASVDLPVEALEPVIAPFGDRLSIAAINAPAATVISGETAAMGEVTELLRSSGANVRPLPVNYAFHSTQMVPYARDLGRALLDLAPMKNDVRFVSTVTGSTQHGAELDGEYWERNVREPVRFAAAIDSLATTGCNVFLELAPHPVLGGAIAETLAAGARDAVVASSLRRGRPELETMLAALGELYCCGVAVEWAEVMPGRRRVDELPTYPWQRDRHWFQRGRRAAGQRAWTDPAAHPLLGRRVLSAAIPGFLFEAQLSGASPQFLADHRIGDIVLAPATAFLELAAAAFVEATSRPAARVHDVELLGALALHSDDEPTTVQVHLRGDSESATFSVSSLTDDQEWLVHATGQVSAASAGEGLDPFELDSIRRRCLHETTGDDLYADLLARDVRFGGSFRGVETVWTGSNEALGRIVMTPALAGEMGRYGFHPALLDATIHPLETLLPAAGTTFLPIALGELRLHRPPAERMWSHVRLDDDVDAATVAADVTVYADDGSLVAELIRLSVVRTTVSAVAELVGRAGRRRTGPEPLDDPFSEPPNEPLYEMVWQPAPMAAASPPPGPWLIVADEAGLGPALARQVEAGGERCVLVRPDEDLTAVTVGELLRSTAAREVVYLRGLDTPALGAGTNSDDVVADQERGLGGALAVTQALLDRPARLWLVSRGAHAVHGPPAAPEQATLSGLGATILAEHPELDCIRIDLDPTHTLGEAASALMAALAASDGEELVAARGDERFGARLVPLADLPATVAGPTRLASSELGVLDGLHLVPLERREPGAGEIEIGVEVTGLNFRDVLVALDLYPERSLTFGDECSGEVIRVGPGVDRLVPGDRVVAMGAGAFASHLTTAADLAIRIPDGLDFEEAATIPIPFLTAQLALGRLGHLAAGERVLIHAAAGGVGMAAVQVAHRIGAEVFATAGSPEKRAALEALGVRHVFDSRSLDFAAGVLDATQGRGVDVVLNSLTGEFIPRSLDVLAGGGRFLEIGKRDIWDAARVSGVRPDVDYHVVFLGDLSVGDPPAIQSMLAEIMPLFAAGELSALPHRAFEVDRVIDAFRYMAQARHIGKIVVSQRRQAHRPAVGPEGTYLVTGGLGGIGLLLARRLVERGARHIALVGRSEMNSTTAEAISRIRELGADIATFRADAARRDDMVRVLAEVRQAMPQLRGVIHAAGINDDAVLEQQTWAHFARALAPKLAGAWHLHALTHDLPLDMFVLVSAAAAIAGGPGQANYAAANAFLDAFGPSRRADGRAGLSISWGPWDRVGMTARLDHHDRARITRRGFLPMTVEQSLAAFDRALDAHAAASVSHVVAIAVDQNALEDRSVLAALRKSTVTASTTASTTASVDLVRLWADTVPGMRRPAISSFVAAQARKVLGLSATSVIAPRQPFHELGLDSLMAVELRNALGGALGRPQPPTLLFDHPTTDALVDHFVELVKSEVDPDGDAPAPTPAPSQTDVGADVDVDVDVDVEGLARLSEAEAEALLLVELGYSETDS